MSKHTHPRSNGFEQLPDAARPIVQSALDEVVQRRASQTKAYEALQRQLMAAGVDSSAIPAYSSFNRLVQRKAHKPDPGICLGGLAHHVLKRLNYETDDEVAALVLSVIFSNSELVARIAGGSAARARVHDEIKRTILGLPQ